MSELAPPNRGSVRDVGAEDERRNAHQLCGALLRGLGHDWGHERVDPSKLGVHLLDEVAQVIDVGSLSSASAPTTAAVSTAAATSSIVPSTATVPATTTSSTSSAAATAVALSQPPLSRLWARV